MSVIVGGHGLDKQGLLNTRGLWNKRGALLGGAIAGGVLVGFNYFYFEEMLAALVLFTVVWLPLLIVAFLLAVFERAGEIGYLRSSEKLGLLHGAARRRLGPAQWAAVSQRWSQAYAQWSNRGMGVAEARAVIRIEQARRRLERMNGATLRRYRGAA